MSRVFLLYFSEKTFPSFAHLHSLKSPPAGGLTRRQTATENSELNLRFASGFRQRYFPLSSSSFGDFNAHSGNAHSENGFPAESVTLRFEKEKPYLFSKKPVEARI
jgi:hypothetical protein